MKQYGDIQLQGPSKVTNFKLQEFTELPTPSAAILNLFFILAEEGEPKKISWYDGATFQYLAIGDVDLTGIIRADGTEAMTADLTLSSTDQSASANTAAVSKGYVQTLLDGKQDTLTLDSSRALATSETGDVVASTVTDVELAYLSGVTSAIQTQLNGKQATLGFTPIDQAGGGVFGNLDFNGFEILGLGAPSTPNSAARKIDLENAIAGLNWQQDVIAFVPDDQYDPGTPVVGDRYVILNAASLHVNFGTISGVEDNDIVEFDGTDFQVAYDITTAGDQSVGTLVTNLEDGMFWRFNGTTWLVFDGAEPVVAGDGIEKSGNVLNVLTGPAIFINGDDQVSIDYRANSGLFTTLDGISESTDELAKLAVHLGASLAFDVDGSIILGSQAVSPANLGAVAGNGLQGGAGTILAARASDGINVDASGISVDTVYLDDLYARLTGANFTGAVNVQEPTTDNNPIRKIDFDTALGNIEGVQTFVYNSVTPVTVHEIQHEMGQQYPNYVIVDENDEVVNVSEIKFLDVDNMRVTTNIATTLRVVLRSQP